MLLDVSLLGLYNNVRGPSMAIIMVGTMVGT
jgi:hypothetical protein